MRVTGLVGALAAPLLLAACMGYENDRPTPLPGPLPGGSWQQSCRDGQVRNGYLRAQCLTANNTYRPAAARIGTCRSFGNRNGTLFCETDGGSNYRWSGSYETSCRDASTGNNGNLIASCQNAKGVWQRTMITPRQCPSYRAGNRNGRLFCEG